MLRHKGYYRGLDFFTLYNQKYATERISIQDRGVSIKLVLVIAPSEGVICGVLNNIKISLIQSIVGSAVCSNFRSPAVILCDKQI